MIALQVREEPFVIVGSTLGELRRVLALLGPLRDGVRHAAYTDWEVELCVRAGEVGLVPRAAVSVSAVVHLPCWRPPPNAPPALVRRWQGYVDGLRRHEDGHVAIARAAGEAVAARLAALRPGAPPQVVQGAAAAAVAEVRAAERAYDDDTRRGATQGAVLSG